jgi:arabinose-5-phosphate isomerase
MKSTEVIPEIVRVLELEGQGILETARRIQKNSREAQNFLQALDLMQQSLDHGGKIIVTGVGKSGKIGQKIASTLCSTGSLAAYIHPTEGLHGDLGMIRKGDIILALSYTGNTDELVKLLPSFKERGVRVIGMGGNSQSHLAQGCDVWLHAPVSSEACPHNLAPTTSTTLMLALGDALAITLMQLRGFDALAFAQNHPGGSLGKKLNLKVEDIMHKGGDLPLLGPFASLEEVVVVSTQKKLGAVLIIEGQKLLGIITDGDIRRSLRSREKFFQLRAHEIMTQDPVSVRPNVMAQTALELMENRPSQISVLPVVDEQGGWLGLVRIHDIVRSF